MTSKLKSWRSLAARCLGAALVSLLTGVCADLFYRMTGIYRLSSLFLGGVLVSAFLFGSGPGYLAGALCFLLYLWLFDPRYTLAFGSTEDFDTLMVFLAVSVLIGVVVGRMRGAAASARLRAANADALLEATREFAAATDEAHVRAELARRLAAVCRGEAVVQEGPARWTWPEAVEAPPPQARPVEGERLGTTSLGGWRLRPLRAGDDALGVAAWRPPEDAPLGQEQSAALDILVDTAAAAVARVRLATAKGEAEARARAEDLRNALLSSISHDMRTPLAAILASASSLHRFAETFDVETRRDLAATIEEETVRLDRFVANLLSMSRLEAGALSLGASPFAVPEAVARVVERCRRAGPVDVTLSFEPGLSEAVGDEGLFEQALGNVVENALRYGAGAPIAIGGRSLGDHIEVWVSDQGSGVKEADLPHIFDKFYRSADWARTPGTGLGLAISKGLVEAMGGAVAARNLGDAGGLEVTLRVRAGA